MNLDPDLPETSITRDRRHVPAPDTFLPLRPSSTSLRAPRTRDPRDST